MAMSRRSVDKITRVRSRGANGIESRCAAGGGTSLAARAVVSGKSPKAQGSRMKNDVRSACLALIRNRTTASPASRSPRPAALGWQLERGVLTAAAFEALRASALGAMGMHAAADRWVRSAALRALLREYRDVRHPVSARAVRIGCLGPDGARRTRRDARPADCA
jgi:hypothetical protein